MVHSYPNSRQSHQKETFSVNRCHIVFAMPKQSIRRSPVPPLSSAADIWTMFLTLLDCNGLCHAMSGKLLSAGISWKVEDSIQKIWSMVPATILWCLWMERNQRFFDGVGRIAGMLSLEVEDKNVSQDALQRVGSELAMHVVAAKPLFLTKEDVSSDALHNEREILKSQAESSGKPQIAIEKMVEGRLRKYFEEVVFMEQKFIVNDTMSVKTPSISLPPYSPPYTGWNDSPSAYAIGHSSSPSYVPLNWPIVLKNSATLGIPQSFICLLKVISHPSCVHISAIVMCCCVAMYASLERGFPGYLLHAISLSKVLSFPIVHFDFGVALKLIPECSDRSPQDDSIWFSNFFCHPPVFLLIFCFNDFPQWLLLAISIPPEPHHSKSLIVIFQVLEIET
ncbi:hypothetical protein FXO37_21994 [Capsicum annuum]|nr:hypothetical protein FXO37_21994 [Capsicum annuum]